MNAAASAARALPAAAPANAVGTCLHCGEALPRDAPVVVVNGQRGAVCCDGCAAAAQWIAQAGLDDYYRLREVAGNRIVADGNDFSSWDRDDVQRGHVSRQGALCEMTLLVEGMHCAACAWLLDRSLSGLPGVDAVGVNAVTGRLRLAWDPAQTALSALLRRIAALGYRPHLSPGEALDRERRRERNALLLRLGVAALATTQAMMFSEALYLDTARQMSDATRDAFRWLTLLVCTPVVFYSGSPFLRGMAREWRQRRLGMDTLAAASIGLAFVASVVETFRGGPHVWFDAAAMFVLFLLAARLLERSARQRAGAHADLLARAQPLLAWRQQDGAWQQVPVAELRIGDAVRVPADAVAPADGELVGDDANFDESLLSGESRPVHKQAGDLVLAGSTCLGSPARLQVRHVGAGTRLSQIARLSVQAQLDRPAIARHAERWASWFVIAMVLVSVAAFVAWWPLAPARAFPIALAVLVAACPCALSLAVPAALAAASEGMARRGLLVLSGEALTRLADIDTVVFDKTGTLTEGEPRIVACRMFDGSAPEHARRVAAALESGGHHPIARAFADASVPAASDVVLHPGRGISGRVDGVAYLLGSAAFTGRPDADDGGVWLVAGASPIARFTLDDALRPDARAVITGLRAAGKDLWLASGDGHDAVAAAALTLGIGNIRARQTPEDKLALLRDLQARGRRVLMIGDGINDAPVLAGADVSMAIAGGSALAQRAADAVWLGGTLAALPSVIRLAVRTRNTIRQSLAWALAYNVVAVAIAASGLIHPGLAALGMVGSSLGVTLNALRLSRAPDRS